MFNSLRKAAVLLPFLAIGTAPVMAQFFTPPVAPEYIYGSTPDVIKPQVTANYSRGNFPSGFGNTDLYLSSWSSNDPNGLSEFIYTFTSPTAPTAIISGTGFSLLENNSVLTPTIVAAASALLQL